MAPIAAFRETLYGRDSGKEPGCIPIRYRDEAAGLIRAVTAMVPSLRVGLPHQKRIVQVANSRAITRAIINEACSRR